MASGERLTPTPAEKATITSYNQYASEWAREHNDHDYWLNELQLFAGLAKNRGTVLEVGCGGGRDAKPLTELGFKYVGQDITPNFLRFAQTNIGPQSNLVNSSVYELPFANNSFDGAWASALFVHLPKKHIPQALKELERVTKPNAISFISVKQGFGEKTITYDIIKDNPASRLWSLFTHEEFAELLDSTGFIREIDSQKKTGHTTWLTYYLRTPGHK